MTTTSVRVTPLPIRKMSAEQRAAMRVFFAKVDTIRPAMLPCEKDPDLWFSTIPEDRRVAILRCQMCPLRRECDVIAEGESHGVWAGKPRDGGRVAKLCEICDTPFTPDKETRAKRGGEARYCADCRFQVRRAQQRNYDLYQKIRTAA